MRRWLLAAAFALAATASTAAATDLRFASGRLSIRTERTRAAELFESVRKKTGVAVALDPALENAKVSVEFDGVAIERAIRRLAGAVPGATGHTLLYARGRDRRTRLVGARVFGPGLSGPAAPSPRPSDRVSRAYAVAPTPTLVATPSAEQRMQRMVDAGVPPETAEKVLELTKEVQQLQATPAPGSLTPDDLGPESRAQLESLTDRGVPMERAVQMLLIQERYRSALEDLRSSQPARLLGAPTPAE